MTTLSDRLIAARSRVGLTQTKAADEAGVSRATVQNAEAGRYDAPSLSTLRALARVYRTSVDALLEPHDEDGSDPFGAGPENDQAPIPTAATR